MCGIAGVLNRNGKPVSERRVRRMADTMAHRGPDDWGVFTDRECGLGHRRLSIIDLTRAGRQPMTDPETRFTITYNGEVYNYKELRDALETRGHVFHTATDTEVVLAAYAQWGADAVMKLNGMFAFAVWDAKRRELFLARDRFGVKPLYYTLLNNTFIFASEIKAILAHPDMSAETDECALKEYLTFQNVYSDRTLFRGVRILRPGRTLLVSAEKFEKRKYWDFVPRKRDEKIGRKDAAKQVREAFERSVRRQLMSDVPVGCYLSGGMDSGSITSVAATEIHPLSTFTGGFDMRAVRGFESFFDEREPAELMSSTFRTEHYELVLRSGDMFRVLPDLVWHLEDLRIGMSWHNYFVARLAAGFVKVVLGGTGGDELFAGYPWRYARGLCATSPDDFEQIYFQSMKRFAPLDTETNILSREWVEATAGHDTFDVFRETLAPVREHLGRGRAGLLEAMLYFEARTFLHGLVVVDDKLSMAHSLENRVPFLDNELAELSLSLPADYKLDIKGLMAQCGGADGAIVSSDGKVVLRRAMKGLVPDDILKRKKQGFTPPESSWYAGPGLANIKEILLDPAARNRPYLRTGLVEKIIDEHAAGRVNHRLLIWSLLCLEWWHRIFIQGRAVPAPE